MDEKSEYIKALKWRLQEIKVSIEDDRRHVRDLLNVIDEKEHQAGYILKLLQAENVSLEDDSFHLAPMSVSDMAYEVLLRQNEHNPIYYRDLAKLIIAEGKLIPGQDPAANLISHLSRDERFVRTDRGTYSLREWGHKPAKKIHRRSKRKR